jgi:hypothetical protein
MYVTGWPANLTVPNVAYGGGAYDTANMGLDNTLLFRKINSSLSMERPCNHDRTEMLARRDGIDYVRCVACGQVYEAEDLEPVMMNDDE